MRALIAIVCAIPVLGACSKGENAGIEEAKKQAEAELKAKVDRGESAKKISPPVPGQTLIPCAQLIDVPKFQEATGELEPLTVKDYGKGKEAEATATCGLIRGGKRPSEAEQQAKLKKEGRLGVLPGDELCKVSAYCWTIEDPERFRAKCKTRKDADDESMGTYACKQLVMVGAFDVFVYRFFDEDTKCILEVSGGPSNTDGEVTRKCAIAARDSIGPGSIAVGGAPAPSEPAPTEGSAAAPAADGSAAPATP